MAEEVLLTIEPVRYLKKDGAIVVTSTRLAFQPAGSDQFDKSFNFSMVKQQRITPDNKPKIMLQIILEDDKVHNFLFVHKDNKVALRDRNQVKILIQELVSDRKKKVEKDFSRKNTLLRSDPRLLQLYKNLVVRRIITPEDFWEKYADKTIEEIIQSEQKTGVTPSFLSDVQPDIDTRTGSVKYRLTHDTINAIFATYPSVKRKYDTSVPNTLSENEFWAKFFQSHYFYRDRKAGEKDTFADCIKEDDEITLRGGSGAQDDPALDMKQMVDAFPAEEEGYGATRKPGTTSMQTAETAEQRKKRTVEPAELVKRYNQHSQLILQQLAKNRSTLADTLSEAVYDRQHPAASSSSNNAHANDSADASSGGNRKRRLDVVENNSDEVDSGTPDAAFDAAMNDDDAEMPLPPDAVPANRGGGAGDDVDISGISLMKHATKRHKLAEMVRLEDLEAQRDRERATLDLSKNQQQYKLCPVPTASTSGRSGQQNAAAATNARQLRLAHLGVKCISDLSRWRNDEVAKSREISSSLLSEITQPNQYDFIGTGTDIDMFPKDARDMLRDTYASLAEVLRHFWSCFPVLNEESAGKLERMRVSLDKLCDEIFPPLRQKLSKISSSSAEVMNHLEEMVRVAREKYDAHTKKPKSSRVSSFVGMPK